MVMENLHCKKWNSKDPSEDFLARMMGTDSDMEELVSLGGARWALDKQTKRDSTRRVYCILVWKCDAGSLASDASSRRRHISGREPKSRYLFDGLMRAPK